MLGGDGADSGERESRPGAATDRDFSGKRNHGLAAEAGGGGEAGFVFPRERLAVLVDGCFWHGCPIHATWPKNNATFWRTKITRNIARDAEVNRLLKKEGWRVLRIWEHDLSKKREARTVRRIGTALGRGKLGCGI